MQEHFIWLTIGFSAGAASCAYVLTQLRENLSGGKPEEQTFVLPRPCRRVSEVTVRDWFAKLDSEVTELKAAILLYVPSLDHRLDLMERRPDLKAESDWNDGGAKDVAGEGADVCTIVTSMLERIGIDEQLRAVAQAEVNVRNKKKGRL